MPRLFHTMAGRLFGLLILLLGAACTSPRVYTFDYATEPDFRWERITSTDPEDGNKDIVRIPANGFVDLPVIEGPAEITRIWFTFTKEAKSHEGLALEITWDDAAGPSVRAPLGMFFGIADRSDVEVENDFLHVAKNESLNSFFPMPFQRNARIRVVNDTGVLVTALYYQVEFKRYDSPRAMRGKMYFHAHYRQAVPAVQREPYLLLDTAGPGVFIGSNLAVAVNSFGWWGEGDETITVDGVATKGTGAEDYYGGAWGWAFQPSKGMRFGVPIARTGLDPGGMWSVYRFHSEAPIRFREHFRFDLEHGLEGYNGREPLANNHYSVAFYYLAEPAVQPPLPSLEERRIRSLPLPVHQPGEWLEFETLIARKHLLSINGGGASTRSLRAPESEKYGGGAEAVLTAFRSGVRYAFPIEIPRVDSDVTVWKPELIHTREPQGLDFDLLLNGRPLATGLSAYGPQREPVTVELPAVALPAGVAMFEVVITGSSPKAAQPPLFVGLDAIRMIRSEASDPFPVYTAQPTTGTALIQLRAVGDAVVEHRDAATSITLEGGATLGGPGELGLILPGDRSRLVMETPDTLTPDGPFSIEMVVTPDAALEASRAQLFSRNLVTGAWLENGRIVFWARDREFRFLTMQTEAGLVPFGVSSRLRFSVEGAIARIHLNGALVRELDMQQFGPLNVYPGRWVLGNTEDLTLPFIGTLEEFYLRSLSAPPVP